jgi:hypothetical protein
MVKQGPPRRSPDRPDAVRVVKCGQMWSNAVRVVKCGQMWSDAVRVVKCGQMWSNAVEGGASGDLDMTRERAMAKKV